MDRGTINWNPVVGRDEAPTRVQILNSVQSTPPENNNAILDRVRNALQTLQPATSQTLYDRGTVSWDSP